MREYANDRLSKGAIQETAVVLNFKSILLSASQNIFDLSSAKNLQLLQGVPE